VKFTFCCLPCHYLADILLDFRGPTGVWTLKELNQEPVIDIEFEEASPYLAYLPHSHTPNTNQIILRYSTSAHNVSHGPGGADEGRESEVLGIPKRWWYARNND